MTVVEVVGAVDHNAAAARKEFPTPPIKPEIASGTRHRYLGDRTRLVVEDGQMIQQTINLREQKQRALDAIEIERRLRALREAEDKERLERAK